MIENSWRLLLFGNLIVGRISHETFSLSESLFVESHAILFFFFCTKWYKIAASITVIHSLFEIVKDLCHISTRVFRCSPHLFHNQKIEGLRCVLSDFAPLRYQREGYNCLH